MKKSAVWFLLVVAAVGLALDLGTKAWAVAALGDGKTMTLRPDTLSLQIAYNPGGAFSMFASVEALPRRFFFVAVSIFAIYFILRLYRRLEAGQRALRWGLPLVLAGALGNLTDRILRGEVVDFIVYRGVWLESLNGFIHSIYSPWVVTDQWPTFNVADIWICAGVVLMLIDSWRPHRRVSSQSDTVAPSAS